MTIAQQTDVHTFTAFGGARCGILACGVGPDELSACVAEVYAFERRLTRFDPSSELSHLNANAGQRVDVTPLLEALLRAALDAHARTDGLVNAAVLPALVAAGYDQTIEQVRRRDHHVQMSTHAHPTPPLAMVLDVGTGWARLAPGCAIDLGGIGKGWLADRLAERLEDCVVNLGGDLRAVGGGPDGGGWPVALCDGAVVRLRDAGAATSGIEGRRWRGGHHLVDPRTGVPAGTDIQAISVVAATAEWAEALAKGAALLGSQQAPIWLQQHHAATWEMCT
jgi:thiamine biosynthesis lipoprotein